MATKLIISVTIYINNDKIIILTNIILDKRRYKNKNWKTFLISILVESMTQKT